MATQTKQKLTREAKALQMFRSGKLAERTEDGFNVPGHNGQTYDVRVEHDQWTCSCPDYLYRGHQGELCKHILFCILLRQSDKMQHTCGTCLESQRATGAHTCGTCPESQRATGAGMAGTAIYCKHKRCLEPKTAVACDSFASREQVVV